MNLLIFLITMIVAFFNYRFSVSGTFCVTKHIPTYYVPLHFDIIIVIIFILKHVIKNPHNIPVINLRGLFETHIFFN